MMSPGGAPNGLTFVVATLAALAFGAGVYAVRWLVDVVREFGAGGEQR
ncbi:hypothetical protein G9U51_08435 [Calidifontibacter sp. DB0510]|uniref:Uncharacterized protein n=1 Tax=Metallococcus carri TaxID=1656884 RepID=A0A967EH14_9MICO|nr:hypothetical protein [Metallococcus carri]NHN55803.1 hypothetical protein [Metallococcus carri]NOP38509.1 hypothetical protein [Calidifontibacter sp. DB2511S]